MGARAHLHSLGSVLNGGSVDIRPHAQPENQGVDVIHPQELQSVCNPIPGQSWQQHISSSPEVAFIFKVISQALTLSTDVCA